MGRYDDQARRRIKAWMAGNPEVTLTALGQAAGYNQPWASRWLVKEEFDASLDALAGMAALFRLPISALFETVEDPREEEVLMRFRALRKNERRQQLVLDQLRDYVPDEPVPRGRARSRKRAGG